jgi:hypothetical protein
MLGLLNKMKKILSPDKRIDSIWCASFDIGSVNFAFYIEEMDNASLMDIENIKDPKSRYNDDGTPTKGMKDILSSVCMNGKTILHKNTDISINCTKGKKLDQNTFHNMTDLLDKYGDYWDKCSYFVVEQQMAFGKMKSNPKAVKLGHHCQSYFLFRYGRFKKVFEFPAYHKTQVLGCEKIKGNKCKNGNYRWKSVPKPLRKKWSVLKATEILKERGEEETMNNIKTVSKKDDLADTVTQLQAFKYLYFIECDNMLHN